MKMKGIIEFEYDLPEPDKADIIENYREDNGHDSDPDDDVFEESEQEFFENDPDQFIRDRLIDGEPFTLDKATLKVSVISRK